MIEHSNLVAQGQGVALLTSLASTDKDVEGKLARLRFVVSGMTTEVVNADRSFV